MNEHLLPSIVQRFIFWLLSCLILAAASCVFPVQAHLGVSEEIVEVTVRIADDPDAPELYLLRGDLHRINGHWSEAVADFNKVQQLDRDNAAAELGLGRTWLDRGQYKKAVKHLNRALTRQPDNVRSLVTRAKAFRLLGEPLNAARDYKQAISTFNDPGKPLPEYYFECARAYESAGASYLDAALQILDAGINRLGNIRILEDYAVDLERMRSNYQAALLRLDRIIDQSTRKESLLIKRGDILLEAGQPAQAEADFAAARDAIDALPAQRRHNRAMKQMRSAIDGRMHSLKHAGDGE